MRFDYVMGLLAGLATTATADSMTVFTKCSLTDCNSGEAYFYTKYGTYKVNANKGCRKTKVPGMTEFCVDWGKNRGHFRFNHQSNKRCLLMRSKSFYACDYPRCHKTEWKESGCSWREMPSNDTVIVTESATATVAFPEETGDDDEEFNYVPTPEITEVPTLD
ncbi:unnamed protein product [Clonostachys solani]|uniref:Secreted protein n=1 Tax=Clonostachys solani TaxID=160281 RepID=A0A9N9ZMF6_9HYPO|nr:unnamed protein product [Clonostachys solani]